MLTNCLVPLPPRGLFIHHNDEVCPSVCAEHDHLARFQCEGYRCFVRSDDEHVILLLSVWGKGQMMPLPLTISCSSKSRQVFIFLVPVHRCSSGQRAVKWVLLLLLFLSCDTMAWYISSSCVCPSVCHKSVFY